MSEEKLVQLQQVYPDAKVTADGGQVFVYIPLVKIPTGGDMRDYAVLLSPTTHSGYDTRFFLDQQVPDRGANWRTFVILGRTWWACSIRGVQQNQPYLQMLLAFLDHFK